MASNQAKPRELEKGKVYLRDTRNGQVHDLQSPLDQMDYMRKFIAGEEEPRAGETPKLIGELTGAARAAEYDRLASMTKEQREAEQSRIDAEREQQAQTDAKAAALGEPIVPEGEPPAEIPTPDGYKLTDKASGASWDTMLKAGWLQETAIQHGMLEKVGE